MLAQEKTKTKGFCLWDDFHTNTNLLHSIPFYEMGKPISFGYRFSNIEHWSDSLTGAVPQLQEGLRPN